MSTAGLEARAYVRAAMDPAYRNRAAVGELAREILRDPKVVLDEEGLGDLPLPLRSRLAAAALRGWTEQQAGTPTVLAWHRTFGPTVVQVGRAAA